MYEFNVCLKVLPVIRIIGTTEVKKQKMIPEEFNIHDIDYHNIFSKNIDNK